MSAEDKNKSSTDTLKAAPNSELSPKGKKHATKKARNTQKIAVECTKSTRQISCILLDLLLVDQNSETCHVLALAAGVEG